jgi:DNA-binding response OmpR family regulator
MGRILIVEDEMPLAELLAWVLQQEGHDVHVATDAAEAIAVGLVELPDLVAADWMLKHALHGGQVCQRLRAARPATKTIVITGHPEIVSQTHGWRDCIDAVIEKPFHMRRLLVAVRRMLP